MGFNDNDQNNTNKKFSRPVIMANIHKLVNQPCTLLASYKFVFQFLLQELIVSSFLLTIH